MQNDCRTFFLLKNPCNCLIFKVLNVNAEYAERFFHILGGKINSEKKIIIS